MATKQHATLTGPDLHVNKIDGTTGTELTTPSEAIYDLRWVKTTGGTVTPAANSTTTLVVNRQDGTTAVLTVDTTSNAVNVGNGTGGNLKIGDQTISKTTGSFFSFGSGLKPSGPLQLPKTTKTGAYTAGATDSTIFADASSGTFQVTLPSAVSFPGEIYTIKRTSASNNVTVGTTSAQTIDGASTKTLGAQYSAITVQSDGANWSILNQLGTVT